MPRKKKPKKPPMPSQVTDKRVQIDLSYKVPTQRTLLRKSKMRKAPFIMDEKGSYHLCDVKKYH